MRRQQTSALIRSVGIIPAVRVNTAEDALFAAEAIFSGGIPVVEITMTIPGAVEVIAQLVREHPDAAVGAGTVVDCDTATRCVEAGAAFLTSTGLVVEILRCARETTMIIPGALTPTEIMTARKAGSEMIKIFPCAQLGGPAYIHALKAPFHDLSFVAAGGITQQTAAEFIKAGADALGIGEDIVPHKAVLRKDVDWIHELTRRFLRIVNGARSQ